MSHTFHLWQGFEYQWDGCPHRVAALAAGLLPGRSQPTRVVAFAPGVDNDTGWLDQRFAELELPDDVSVQEGTLELVEEDHTQGRNRDFVAGLRASTPDGVPVTLSGPALPLPEGHDAAVILLQGFEWFPCRKAGSTPFDGIEIVETQRVWPTRFAIGVSGEHTEQTFRPTATIRLVHMDSPDSKQPPNATTHHHLRVHYAVLSGPAGSLRPEARELVPWESRRLLDVIGAASVPLARTATAVGLSSFDWHTMPTTKKQRRRRKSMGRYLKQLGAFVQGPHDNTAGNNFHADAECGWRSSDVPYKAKVSSSLQGCALHITSGELRERLVHSDAIRYALGRNPHQPGVPTVAWCGSVPPRPNARIQAGSDPVRFEVRLAERLSYESPTSNAV